MERVHGASYTTIPEIVSQVILGVVLVVENPPVNAGD